MKIQPVCPVRFCVRGRRAFACLVCSPSVPPRPSASPSPPALPAASRPSAPAPPPDPAFRRPPALSPPSGPRRRLLTPPSAFRRRLPVFRLGAAFRPPPLSGAALPSRRFPAPPEPPSAPSRHLLAPPRPPREKNRRVFGNTQRMYAAHRVDEDDCRPGKRKRGKVTQQIDLLCCVTAVTEGSLRRQGCVSPSVVAKKCELFFSGRVFLGGLEAGPGIASGLGAGSGLGAAGWFGLRAGWFGLRADLGVEAGLGIASGIWGLQVGLNRKWVWREEAARAGLGASRYAGSCLKRCAGAGSWRE